MIDTENLCTASLYINNQLVSRGLLRDGQAIDFAQMAGDDRGSAAMAGRIISILNDLILRRDRDAEHRESLAVAMRSLRAENLKHANDIARLTEKNAEEKRRAEIASAAEAALRTQLKSAEATARSQKEEISRAKSLVSQTRSTCATEVRRRDRQIDTLKKQLAEAGRSRGSKANPSVTTIHVTGDIGAEKDSPVRAGSASNGDCNLRNETNAFLAKLAQDLSEENEAILNVMQQTMGQLREMSACPEEERQESDVVKRLSCDELVAELASVTDHMRNILTNPSFVPIEEVMVRDEEIGRLRSGWVKMEGRWKEAVRLIDGWRKRMAASGKPVCDEELKMGLRLSPVRVNDVDETKEAFDMGLSAVVEEAEEDAEIAHESPSPPSRDRVELVPEADYDDAGVPDAEDDATADFEENITILDRDSELEATVEAPRYQSSPGSSPLPEPPQLSPLRNSASAGNRGPLQGTRLRPRLGDFTTIVEEKTQELAAEAKSLRSLPLRQKGPSAAAGATGAPQTRLPSRGCEPQGRARSPSHTSLDEVLLARPRPARAAVEDPVVGEDRRRPGDDDDDDDDGLSNRPKSTLANSRDVEPEQSPQLTMTSIAAKLAASEKEADAARVRAKLKAARSSRGGVARPTTTTTATTTTTTTASDAAPVPSEPAAAASSAAAPFEDVDPVKHDVAPPPPPPHQQLPLHRAADEPPRPVEKRKRERRTSKAASRRRSTLSPWELQALMSGGGAS
ncbi:afadin- and alpha -actinin-Binding domain-containing protein [Hirsutella rhossiliensis]|uniref:Afadin- and alpha -actinin-Binding domain-containing protein n=1 Tax=Hirsutella rhossiliensis TaxID=111463 RepID=A0A9P8N8B1_9HYPO|nr:afadin- and alpha -actinin-Binding domain-containing protein [Hirsutella rhossiliensis]KAH0967544.1 afadin- and alpha -actinin-Binding domain-containing protein [Hirsutella rhossiliensis]